ncbi:relaxase/mobilization nuclease domain-containing protein [Staphylococcus epidermidis]|uniref:relaxase/mobilization nuclease domain-containing protein n=1 Tax=Staphylococcus epidermidis TaxID=1282 RepID=UPI0034E2ABDF
MATTKLGNTKSASRAINYAEKRAVEKSGLNCDVDYAKSAFKQTRALYGKEDGIQAHTIIQSFKPDEVTPEQCNQLGLELAEKGIVFDREEYSWKDELRELIENAKTHTSNLETFSEHLEEKGVKVKLRGETISYKPENANKWVRGRTLGSDYEKGAIDDEHERHQEQQREPEYADGFKVNWDAVEQHTKQLEKRRIERTQKTKQANRKVFGRDRREPENERERTRSNHIKIERDDEGLSR